MKPVDLDMFRVAFVRVYVQYFTAVCVCVERPVFLRQNSP